MLMYILQRECIRPALFRIKADWDTLYGPDIIYRTFLVKIGQRNVPGLFVYFNRRNRSVFFE